MKARLIAMMTCLCMIQGCTVIGAFADEIIVNSFEKDEHPLRKEPKNSLQEEGPFQYFGQEIDSALYQAIKKELESNKKVRFSANTKAIADVDKPKVIGLCPRERQNSDENKCFSAEYYEKYRALIDADKSQ